MKEIQNNFTVMKIKIKNITGLHTNYDVPTNPDITIDTSKVSKTKAVNRILEELNIKK